MILNKDLPRRASRAWCVPFAGLALGLFALPVQAQQQDPDPVQIEIRINGKPLQNLSKKQQNALLEVLLENQSATEQKQGRAAIQQPKKPSKNKRRPADTQAPTRAAEQAMPVAVEVQKAMQEGLAEARREILNDPDLKELGITDEVLEMIDGIGNGKGIESSIDGVVRAAMKGVGKMVAKELQDDEDLRSLGLDKGIATLITGLLEQEFSQKMVSDLARTAMGSALDEAKAEIRADADLQKLGIGKDVEGLIDAVVSGQGDFESSLNKVIEKAMAAAMQEGLTEVQADASTKAKAKKQKKAKKDKPAVKVRRQSDSIR